MSIALTSITDRSLAFFNWGRRVAQRFRNAYLDDGKEFYVRAATEATVAGLGQPLGVADR